MRIPRSIAFAASAAALAVTAACNTAVEANPELHDTKGAYGGELEYTAADYALDLPQSATIDSATAVEAVRKGPAERPAPETPDDGEAH